MNNNRPCQATPRAGGGTSVLRQIKGKQAGNETNDTPASTVKEGIVQKLQGVLFAVRRDRDREHRNRDIAMEKLRSAKELYETDKSNFEAEKEKLAKTQEEAEKTQQEILEKEQIVAELKQKVREAKRFDAFNQVSFSLWRHFGFLLSISSSTKICFASGRRFSNRKARSNRPLRNETNS